MEPAPVDPNPPQPTALDSLLKRLKDPAVWLMLLLTLLVGSEHVDKIIPEPDKKPDTTVVVNPPAPTPAPVPTPAPPVPPVPTPDPSTPVSVLVGTQFIILDDTGTRTSAADIEKLADKLKIGRYTAQSIPKAGEKIRLLTITIDDGALPPLPPPTPPVPPTPPTPPVPPAPTITKAFVSIFVDQNNPSTALTDTLVDQTWRTSLKSKGHALRVFDVALNVDEAKNFTPFITKAGGAPCVVVQDIVTGKVAESFKFTDKAAMLAEFTKLGL